MPVPPPPKLLSVFCTEDVPTYASADVVRLAKWLGLPSAVVSNESRRFKTKKLSIADFLWRLSPAEGPPEKRRRSANVLFHLYHDEGKQLEQVVEVVERSGQRFSEELRTRCILYSPSPAMKQRVARLMKQPE